MATLGKNKLCELRGVHLFKRFVAKFVNFIMVLDKYTLIPPSPLKTSSSTFITSVVEGQNKNYSSYIYIYNQSTNINTQNLNFWDAL